MANSEKENKPQKNERKGQNTQQQNNSRQDADERKRLKEKKTQDWLEKKARQSQDLDTHVLRSQTQDTGEYIDLIRLSDNLIYKMRMKAGHAISFEKAQEFFQRHEELKKQLNILNAEITSAFDWNYNAPRGFDNPFPKKVKDEKAPGKDTAI